MAITIDWGSKIINIPRTDMTLIQSVPTEIRQLDLDSFRITLNDLQDGPEGIVELTTHTHNTTVTVGGVTLARVIEIINGYTITFEDGQYAVNLTGANSNIGDVTNVNQVSVRSSNSAGLVSLDILVAGAYGGKVVINPITGQTGTDAPIGTFETPVSNIPDAVLIAGKQGVVDLLFTTSMTINEDLTGGVSGQPCNITGTTPFNVITLNSAALLSGVGITGVTVQGELDGLNTIRECSLLSCTSMSGFVFQCSIVGPIAINGTTSMMQCFSGLAGSGSPELSVTAGNLIMRDFSGSLTLKDITQGTHSIGVYGGKVTIDATCTAGDIHIRGDAYEIINNSTGAIVVDERSGLTSAQDAKLTAIPTAVENATTLLDSIP